MRCASKLPLPSDHRLPTLPWICSPAHPPARPPRFHEELVDALEENFQSLQEITCARNPDADGCWALAAPAENEVSASDRMRQLIGIGMKDVDTETASVADALTNRLRGLMHACPGSGEMCLGGEDWTACEVGHKPDSPLCAVCRDNWVMDSEGMCSLCPPKDEVIFRVCVILGSCIVGAFVLLAIKSYLMKVYDKIRYA